MQLNGDSNYSQGKMMQSFGLIVKKMISFTMTLIKIGKLNFIINVAASIKIILSRKNT